VFAHIGWIYELLMRVLTLQRRTKKIEEYADEIHVREAENETGEGAGDEEACSKTSVPG